MVTKIYTLTNPITGLIFYVGKTTQDLKIRLACHCNEYSNPKNQRSLKREAIISIILEGERPIIEEIDRTEEESQVKVLELYWMRQLKSWGFPITNREVNKQRSYEVLYTENFPYGVCVIKGQPEPSVEIFKKPHRHDGRESK